MNDNIASYNYGERSGIKIISWEEFNLICKGLSASISKYYPEIIVGIARGGLYPATLISHILQKNLFPISLTRRENDLVVNSYPKWGMQFSENIKGKKIVIVDEICDSGETLNEAKKAALNSGARKVITAVMYSHVKSSKVPDIVGIISDQLIVNPWDKEVLKEGAFEINPEYKSAFGKQGVSEEILKISSELVIPEKG